MAKKVTNLREAVSFEGLVALGVDTLKNESVQVPLGFVKQGADAAIAAAQSATTAAKAAVTATETIDTKIANKLNTPTVTAPSVSEISSLVGLNTSGVSVNASPDQIREMVGIDYSLLTEQIVPGEYFVNRKGERRQVYSRTIVFKYSTQWYSIFSGASSIMSYSLNDMGATLDGSETTRNIIAPEIYVLANGTVQIVIGAEQIGRYYSIHIKYTKP